MNFGLLAPPRSQPLTPPAAFDAQVLTVRAGLAIRQGELVTLTEDGLARAVDPAQLTGEAYNTVGLTASVAPMTLGPHLSAHGHYSAESPAIERLATMGNGLVAMVYMGDRLSTSAANVNLEIWRGSVRQAGPIIVDTDSGLGAGAPQVFALGDDRCVVVWAVSPSVQFRIYNSAGVPITAVVSLADTWGSNHTAPGMCSWPNGDFALAYKTGTNWRWYRFDRNGTAVGSAVTFETAGNNGEVRGFACSNGDLALQWNNGTNYRAGRWNAAGTQVGVSLTLNTTSNIGSGMSNSGTQLFVEFPSGRIAYAIRSQSNTNNLFFTNVAHTALDASRNAYDGLSPYFYGPPCISNHPQGLIFFRRHPSQTAAVFARVYTETGEPIGGAWTSDTMFSGSINLTWLRVNPVGVSGALGYILVASSNNSGSNNYVDISWLDANLTLRGSRVAITHTGAVADVQGAATAALSGGDLLVQWQSYTPSPGSSSLMMAAYRVLRRSIIGVALEPASPGQRCRVAARGAAELSAPVVGTWDHRTNAVPGTRGIASGPSAMLLGVA